MDIVLKIVAVFFWLAVGMGSLTAAIGFLGKLIKPDEETNRLQAFGMFLLTAFVGIGVSSTCYNIIFR